MSFAPGQTLGNYQIVQRIGVGGMGEVFLAEHPLIGKKVALKVIHRELAQNKEVVTRFFTEARAANTIGNEHIVEVHDFGQTDDGEYFFIMEYLEGRTLAHEMAEVRVLPVQRALHIGAQIAHALGAAHACGIIHRDLKPDNVMLVSRLGDGDFVKVLDFGLAKFFAAADARKLTAVGVVLGTPQYMSPEACESRQDIDHRADVYSLGILLFQMLCGRVPFAGDAMGEVLVKQVAQLPPALRGFNPEVPPAVEQIVLRCLAKPPAARFQTMDALRGALLDPDRYLGSSPPVMPQAAAADARTVYGDARGVRGTAPPPELARPQLAENRTMAIMTPPGYVGRRSRRLWLALLILVLGGAAGASLLVASGVGQGTTAAIDAAPAGPGQAHIKLSTIPSGAQVFDGAGGLLGVTPTTLVLPIDGREVTLVFRHPGAGEREQRFVPRGDESFAVELPAAAPLPSAVPARSAVPSGSPGGAPAASDAGPVAAPIDGGAPVDPKRHHHRRATHHLGDGTLPPDFGP